jgi:hypothetical protein
MLLPVTPFPMRGPGWWGSPFGRPIRVELRHHPRGVPLPKGVWMVRCGPNRVELVWREDEDFDDEPRRAPGTGLLRPPKHPEPPWPTPPPLVPRSVNPAQDTRHGKPGGGGGPGPGHNALRREELIRPGSTGTVFADGHSVILSGAGEAIAIRVFG